MWEIIRTSVQAGLAICLAYWLIRRVARMDAGVSSLMRMFVVHFDFHKDAHKAAKTLEQMNLGMNWFCPQCTKMLHWDYDSLVNAGTPICGECEADMERCAMP